MSTDKRDRPWVDDLEVANANVKWGFSRFQGQKDLYNAEGERNFVIIIPPEDAMALIQVGWNIKEKPGMDPEDPNEFHLKCNISYRFDPPAIYFIKGDRKYPIDHPEEINQIKRATCEKIDVILQPSPFEREDGSTGFTPYVKEMYVTIRESRFGAQYADYQEVRTVSE